MLTYAKIPPAFPGGERGIICAIHFITFAFPFRSSLWHTVPVLPHHVCGVGTQTEFPLAVQQGSSV